MIPQLIIITLGVLSVGLNLGKHGKKKKQRYNVWHAIIGTGISWVLLYWGGFWNVIL